MHEDLAQRPLRLSKRREFRRIRAGQPARVALRLHADGGVHAPGEIELVGRQRVEEVFPGRPEERLLEAGRAHPQRGEGAHAIQLLAHGFEQRLGERRAGDADLLTLAGLDAVADQNAGLGGHARIVHDACPPGDAEPRSSMALLTTLNSSGCMRSGRPSRPTQAWSV